MNRSPSEFSDNANQNDFDEGVYYNEKGHRNRIPQINQQRNRFDEPPVYQPKYQTTTNYENEHPHFDPYVKE